MNERSVLDAVRLEASRLGIRLWRNNSGCAYTQDGRLLRYGLANDSAAVNDVMKSADLIGIRPMVIEPWMIGGIAGIFVSVECKASDWKPDNSPRTKAQIVWRDLITALGGEAYITTHAGIL